MKFFLLIFLVLSSIVTMGQSTIIPDPVFEQILIDLGYDTGTPNGTVPTANISSITSLVLEDFNTSDPITIYSLIGIEDFTSLEELTCIYHSLSTLDLSSNLLLNKVFISEVPLSSIDLSQNSLLTDLTLEYTNLNSLDVTQNINLINLTCSYGSINYLDLSSNSLLENLVCEGNLLSSLNLSQNGNLNSLFAAYNQLECLNLKNGNNSNMTELCLEGNNNLSCIAVDDTTWVSTCWSDALNWNSVFSNDCTSICSALGKNELSFINNYKVFPNPSEDDFTIQLDVIVKDIMCTLYNNLGQMIDVFQVQNTNKIRLNFTASAGLYLLLIEVDGQTTVPVKLIKEK